MTNIDNLKILTSKELLSILYNIAKSGKKKYKIDNVKHIYNAFSALHELNKKSINNLYHSQKFLNISTQSVDIVYYEEILRLNLTNLNSPHGRLREPDFDKLLQMVDKASYYTITLEQTEKKIIEIYKNALSQVSLIFPFQLH
jgi:hypothetical protein